MTDFLTGAQGWVDPGADLTAAGGGASWYAIHVRSNFEKRVAADLSARGLVSYLPAVAEVHTWSDRRKVVETPLFPGYVFSRFEDTPSRRVSVLRTPGAVRILGFGDALEPVPDAELEAVRRLIQANVPLLAHPLLKEGAWVRIRRGPLRDVEGLLVRIKSQTRLVLSVELLARSVSTEIDAGDVEVVRSPWRPAGVRSN